MVRSVQSALVANGINVVVDGIFGPQTQGGVVTFQTRRALPANGIVDVATWRALGLPG
jgi:peptidoglycan hydrolase-like protein with peptidoglycan-binding domain